MIIDLFISILVLVPSAGASKVRSAEDLALQIKTEQQQMSTKEEAKRGILAQLYSVNKNLQKLNGERSKIEKNLRKASENVGALTTLIQQMDEKLNGQRRQLRERVKALSKMQGQGYVRVLFGSQSSVDRSMNLKVIKAVTERDFRLIRQHKENLTVFKAQKQKLDNQEQKLANLKKNLDGKQKHLGEQASRKSNMLKNIDSDRILHGARLRRLRLETQTASQNSDELRKIKAIEDLFAEQIFERKGSLNPPVLGKIKFQYGWLPDLELNTKIRFKGSLLDSKAGETVKSVYRGEVVFAENVKGYGRTVVVDHGNHYYSVYANLGEYGARAGQKVAEGQSIGTMGTQQAFFGSGLYFELRHFSEPENPAEWVRLADRK